ncbi:MAG: hypothetical protein WCK17_02845 [Verrucomicrobiota bacterium]
MKAGSNAHLHYGFSVEELDFLVDDEIKYRLGRSAGGKEEGE